MQRPRTQYNRNNITTANRKLKIGLMPYLNSEVFYRTLDPDSCDLVTARPRAMALAVENGELDGGPLPVAEVFRLGEKVREVGELGVAIHGKVLSVLLLSDVPAEQLNGQRIAVTEDTATSVQLLRVLCADHWKIKPELVAPGSEAPARLVIGDEANRLRKVGASPHIYDLSEEWQKLTKLPFVFAVWVLRSDLPEGSFKAFEKALVDAYCEGRQQVGEIAAARKTEWMSEAECAEYVRNFSYTIGDAERRGMQEFHRRLSTLPQWRPPAPKLTVGMS